MIDRIQSYFRERMAPLDDGGQDVEHGVRLATAALFIEMTKADFEIKDEEKAAVLEAVCAVLQISRDDAREVIDLANTEVQESVSLYQFTRLVNESFPPQRKKEIVELLWRIAFADSRLDEHEEYMVRKVASLLHVPHRDFIDAKRRARGTASHST